MFEAVPAELKAYPQWLLWRKVWLADKGKFTKQPLRTDGRLASVTNAHDWTTFDGACAVLQQHYKPGVCDGLGFVFGHASGTVGIDLDRVFDSEGRILDHRAHAIADALGSYTEVSPSGTGLHVLALGSLAGGRRRENVEVYGEGRYFTITGVPYGVPRPLANRQQEVAQLVAEIDEARAAAAPGVLDWGVAPKYTNEALWNMARGADNGEKFFKLWNGAWQEYYSSQSEADFALIDILAFYTDSPSQVREMFMLSSLGQRDKARERPGYVVGMIQRSFDRKVPLVNVPVLSVVAAPQIVAYEPTPDLEPEDTEEAAALADKPYACPAGLVGEIASWCWAQSRWPMEELCLVAALGIVAGIAGRQYQFEGSGLNLYMMMLAGTGAGKEALSGAVSKLFTAVTAPPDVMPLPGQPAPVGFVAAEDFYGPTQLTGKGLLRTFNESKTLSCVSVVPEFSQVMTQMADPRAHAGLREFQQVLLDFYMKSSAGSRYGGSRNAEKVKDIGTIKSPSFTLVCEGTPERFWRAMSEHMVTDGLMSRFIVFERPGYDMIRNEDVVAHSEVPDALKQRVSTLCETVLMMQTTQDTRINVGIADEARGLSREIEDGYRQRGITGGNEVHKVLWFRAHQNIMRMAALVAIGCDYHTPTITVEHIRWAQKIVHRQVTLLVGKFRRGEIGDVDRTEQEQYLAMRGWLERWIKADPASFKGNNAKTWALAHGVGVVPMSFFDMRARSLSCFIRSRYGVAETLRRTVQHYERIGVLKRVTLDKHSGEFYSITL